MGNMEVSNVTIRKIQIFCRNKETPQILTVSISERDSIVCFEVGSKGSMDEVGPL